MERWTHFLQHQTKWSKISRVQWCAGKKTVMVSFFLFDIKWGDKEMEREWSAALCFSLRVFDFFAAFMFSGQWKVQISRKWRKTCWQYPLSSLRFKFCLHWFDYLATSSSYWWEILDNCCAKLSPPIKIFTPSVTYFHITFKIFLWNRFRLEFIKIKAGYRLRHSFPHWYNSTYERSTSPHFSIFKWYKR